MGIDYYLTKQNRSFLSHSPTKLRISTLTTMVIKIINYISKSSFPVKQCTILNIMAWFKGLQFHECVLTFHHVILSLILLCKGHFVHVM